MKKILLLLISLIGFIVITACGGSNSWNVTLEQTPAFTDENAEFIAVQITDESKQPVEGLNVNASFEMVKMDHGVIESSLQSGGDGIYQGNFELPMDGEWQVTITMSDGKTTQESIIAFKAEALASGASSHDNAIAFVNDNEIGHEDIEFYEFINILQIAMYRENDKKNFEGDELEQAMKYWDAQEEAAQHQNTLLTQIIRLKAAALLAEEKGHVATDKEIANEINKVKEIYAASPAATKLISEYGEDKFWDKQQSQYELIVLTSKVQDDVMDLVKQANPEAEAQELNMLAQKKYEELLVSQVSTLDIQVN